MVLTKSVCLIFLTDTTTISRNLLKKRISVLLTKWLWKVMIMKRIYMHGSTAMTIWIGLNIQFNSRQSYWRTIPYPLNWMGDFRIQASPHTFTYNKILHMTKYFLLKFSKNILILIFLYFYLVNCINCCTFVVLKNMLLLYSSTNWF